MRAVIAATAVRPADASSQPGLRFGLIDHALAQATESGAVEPAVLDRLKRDLAVSAEALFSLTDLQRLDSEHAIVGLMHTATSLTRAALWDDEHAVSGAKADATAPPGKAI
ncbi:hypothetical protein ABZ922_45050 [Streptomyces shenzhenensis]|uniref:hypothetical protein n=1 Tax=Streptomyces shenzhenensis TaxID=943815 RepID=UPI0033D9C68B